MKNTLENLYEIIEERKSRSVEGSYTCYLFEKGLDKILKKCAEECGEVLIAAKNDSEADLTEEICDLTYHLLVLLVQKGIPLSDIKVKLEERAQKQRNLKEFHISDKDS